MKRIPYACEIFKPCSSEEGVVITTNGDYKLVMSQIIPKGFVVSSVEDDDICVCGILTQDNVRKINEDDLAKLKLMNGVVDVRHRK